MADAAREKLWTREFASLFCARFVVNITFYMLGTTLAMIVYDIYQASPAVAGITLGAYAFGLVIGRLFFARYTDVVGRKRLILFMCGLTLVAIGTYYLPVPIQAFTAFRLFHGTCMGVLTNTLTTAAIATIPRSRFSEGVNIFSLSVTLCSAIGPFLGYVIMQYFDQNVLYAACLACMVITFFIISSADIKEIELTPEQRKRLTGGLHVDQMVEKKAIPLSIVVGMLSNACYIIIMNFLPSFGAEAGFYDYASLYFAVYAVFVLVLRPIAGRIMDKHGDNVIMIPSMITFAVGLCFLSQCSNVWMLVAVAIVNAFGQATTFSGGQAIVSRNVEPHRLSIVNSTYYTLADVGFGAGPFLFGLIVPYAGYSGMYLCSAGVMVVAAVLYYVVHGRKAGKPVEE